MRKLVLAISALATALPAASALGAPAYFSISRCSVVDARTGEPLLPGTPPRLAIDAAACGVPASASAVLVELAAVTPSPARVVAVPGGRNLAEETVLAAGTGREERTTLTVPLDRESRGELAVGTDAGAGTASN